MALEYTTEIAGERYGADERAQYEVTINDDGLTVRDRLNRKEVSMTHDDFNCLLDHVRAFRNAANLLETV
jgi:hypothetical protein